MDVSTPNGPDQRDRYGVPRVHPMAWWHTLWPSARHGVPVGRTPRVELLELLVRLGSLLDAHLTILHVQSGGCELNPLMAVTLAHGVSTFVALKLD